MSLPAEFIPPWKDGKVDRVIAHWTHSPTAAGRSGLYETTKELVMAESQIDGVLGIMLDPEDPEGGKIDPIDSLAMNYAHNFGYKWADIHVVHNTTGGISDRLKPKIFAIHGTPEAMLYSELNPTEAKSRSFTAGLEWLNTFEATFVYSMRHFDIWKTFARNGPLYYVPKGVDLVRYRPNGMAMDLEGEPRILYGEIFRKIKDPFLLFFALQEVFKQHPAMRFHPWGFLEGNRLWSEIVGRGGFSDFIGKYRLAGRQIYPEHWFRGGDITVTTTMWGEPSRVAIESLACGTPVIAWDTSPYEDSKFSETAKAFNVSALAMVISSFWEDMKDDPEKARKKARALAESTYDIHMTAQAVVQLVDEVLRR